MATAADIIARAKSQVGYKENPAGSNHTKFGVWYGMDHEPWCAMFVSWVFYFCGVPLKISTSKGYSYCPSGVAWFKSHGLWRSSYRSQTGDVVFFNFSGGSEAEHTGIVLHNDPTKSYIITIEGNTGSTSAANGGEVAICTRPRSFVLGTGNTQGFLTSSTPRQRKKTQKKAASSAASWTTDNGHYGHPNLKKGASSEPVKHLQQLLLKAGINIVVDGQFGDHTEVSVKKFQSFHGLTVDGVVGSYTWHALHVGK